MGCQTSAHTELFIFINEKLGFINHTVVHIEIKDVRNKYMYLFYDHLGNTRVLFKDKNADGIIKQDKDEVIEVIDYYPFGMEDKKQNNQLTVSNLGQKKHQGQERTFDLGLNIDEWKYRISVAAIGRFC